MGHGEVDSTVVYTVVIDKTKEDVEQLFHSSIPHTSCYICFAVDFTHPFILSPT